MVTGMTTNISDFDDLKSIGRGFKEAFSDKDFEGKDSSYPYSQKYFREKQKDAVDMLNRAWNTAIENISGANLEGASGSEAVRQARLNAGDVDKKPNRVEIEDYDKK